MRLSNLLLVIIVWAITSWPSSVAQAASPAPAVAPSAVVASAPADPAPPPPPAAVVGIQPVPDPEGAKQALVGDLLEATGVHGELSELGGLVAITLQYYLNRNPDTIGPKVFDDLVVVAEQAFDGKAIYQAVEKQLATELDESRVRTLLDWYKSSTGKHFHAMETSGGHSAGLRDLPTFLALTDTGPLDGERLQAAHALDRAMFLSDDQLNVMMAVYRGARMGLNAYLPKNKQLSKADLDTEFTHVRISFRDMVVKAVLGGVVAILQPMQLDEFATYTTFARGAAFQGFNRIAAKVVGRELDKAAAKAAHDIAAYKEPARALAGTATH